MTSDAGIRVFLWNGKERRANVNLTRIWQATLGTMQLQVSRQDFDTLLRGVTLLSLDNGMATIGTRTPSQKEGLENNYMAPLRRSIGDIVGFPVQVRFIIAPSQTARSPISSSPPTYKPDAPAGHLHPEPPHNHEGASLNGHDGAEPYRQETNGYPFPEPASPSPSPAHPPFAQPAANKQSDRQAVQLELSSAMRSGMLNPKYTFLRFIVGSSNRLAHAACMAVADHPAMAYNPLFIYGGVGLGKTHLLHAIGNRVLDRDPEINVLYVSSEKFTNDLINAIRRQQTEEFRIRYRNIDVLLIDDIQFIAGKDATQEEFFHTFNTLHSASKQIVISSDRPPKAIITLEERLRSRFEWGLIVDIQPPDLETRTAILRDKGDQMSVEISSEVIDFLASKIQSNIRELEGSINRVVAYAELHKTPITIEVAAAALAELLDNTNRKRVTPEMVLKLVSEYYHVEVPVLQGRGRSRNIVIPRQVAMYLLREETGCSLVEIGSLLGGRDHTTVMYGCDKMAEEINADSRLRNEVLSIRNKLYS
jgi:chromosomal replication initiator protein